MTSKPSIRPLLVACRRCGLEHEVPPAAIIASVWMRCYPPRNDDALVTA